MIKATRIIFSRACMDKFYVLYNDAATWSRLSEWNLTSDDRSTGKTCSRPTGFNVVFRGIHSNSALSNQGESRDVNLTATKSNILYVDTLALVTKLEKAGFPREQAEVVTRAFVDVINTTIEYQTKTLVTKPQQEIMVQQLMSHIGSVKKDMVILEKSEFTMIRNDTEKQSIEIRQLKQHLDDEIKKLKGQITLDINLERSRATEAHAINERDLQKLSNKIDTEVANLRTTYEQYRNDVQKYAAGTVLTCFTLCLGFLRLWS
ncbi:hypothetical protein ACJMK2_010690 [Sinanodonta woodiana]|uniref:Mitochondrial calcium uniporter regulator 1 n=1 Tax=Sinanodonta woodiana TaxID=1069815 RepID=A0ABD3VJA7_SINWO